MGRFESYAAIIGGILDSAGIPGFLANRDELYESSSDAEASEWATFLAKWNAEKPDTLATTKDCYPFCMEHELLPSIVTKTEVAREIASQKRILGRALRSKVGTVLGGFRLELSGKELRSGTHTYKVISLPAPSVTSAPATLIGNCWHRLAAILWYFYANKALPLKRAQSALPHIRLPIDPLPTDEAQAFKRISEGLLSLNALDVARFRVTLLPTDGSSPSGFRLDSTGHELPSTRASDNERRRQLSLPAISLITAASLYQAHLRSDHADTLFSALDSNGLTSDDNRQISDLCHHWWQHYPDAIQSVSEIWHDLSSLELLPHFYSNVYDNDCQQQMATLMSLIVNRPFEMFKITHPVAEEIPRSISQYSPDELFVLKLIPGHIPPPRFFEEGPYESEWKLSDERESRQRNLESLLP